MDRLLQDLPRVTLPAALAAPFLQGQPVRAEGPGGACRVYREDGLLLGVGEQRGGSALHPVRLLASG